MTHSSDLPTPLGKSSVYGLISAIFAAVILLEYSTPPAFVFGYLYAGAIVLANRRLERTQVMIVTLLAAGLTLLNLVLPSLESHSLPTVSNRLIAVVALLVAGYLSDRNRFYETQIARQQAELQAQAQLASLREDFVSTLTHDLKTPLLGAIETINSFLVEQFGPVSPAQRKILDMMQRSHRATLHLVETLLDVYRNDAEGLGLALAPVELRSLLANTVAQLTHLAQSRQIHLRLLATGAAHLAYGDATQLRRVFENLIVNAINHAPRGTSIEIVLETVQQPEPAQQIRVCDQGGGIPSQALPQLFERFYQGNGRHQARGSGLGLYLSRQIVEAHSGKIWAENRQPQGAIFYCRLPAVLAHDRLPAAPAPR